MEDSAAVAIKCSPVSVRGFETVFITCQSRLIIAVCNCFTVFAFMALQCVPKAKIKPREPSFKL